MYAFAIHGIRSVPKRISIPSQNSVSIMCTWCDSKSGLLGWMDSIYIIILCSDIHAHIQFIWSLTSIIFHSTKSVNRSKTVGCKKVAKCVSLLPKCCSYYNPIVLHILIRLYRHRIKRGVVVFCYPFHINYHHPRIIYQKYYCLMKSSAEDYCDDTEYIDANTFSYTFYYIIELKVWCDEIVDSRAFGTSAIIYFV